MLLLRVDTLRLLCLPWLEVHARRHVVVEVQCVVADTADSQTLHVVVSLVVHLLRRVVWAKESSLLGR